jgi:hypothetical protein
MPGRPDDAADKPRDSALFRLISAAEVRFLCAMKRRRLISGAAHGAADTMPILAAGAIDAALKIIIAA